MRDANENQMRNYQNMHFDLGEMHRKYPTNVHTERLAQEGSTDIKNPINNKVNSDELAELLEAKVKSLKSAQVLSVHDERNLSSFTKGDLTIDELKTNIANSTKIQNNFKEYLDFVNGQNISEQAKKEKISESLDVFTKSPSQLPPAIKQATNEYLSGKNTYENMSNRIDHISKLRSENIDKIYDNFNEHSNKDSLNNSQKNEVEPLKNEPAKPAIKTESGEAPRPATSIKSDGPQPAPSNSNSNSNKPSM